MGVFSQGFMGGGGNGGKVSRVYGGNEDINSRVYGGGVMRGGGNEGG